MSPLVTIGITCYNAENTISDAIKSALSQDYENIEIIVVDDFSDDGSVSVIEKHISGNNSIQFIRNMGNKGAAESYNTIIDAASGDYVAFFDDDDISLPDRVRRSIDVLLKSPPESLFFCDRFVGAKNGIEISGIRPLKVDSRRLEKYMLDAVLFHYDSKFYKTNLSMFTSITDHAVSGSAGSGIMTAHIDVLRKIRFNAELRRFGDTDFNLRAAAAGSGAVGFDEPLMIQKISDGVEKTMPVAQDALRKIYRSNSIYFDKYRICHPMLDIDHWHLKSVDGLNIPSDGDSTTVRSPNISTYTPLATLGLLTFNCVDTISASLNSALSQDIGDFEILIIDDHSTDQTRDYLQYMASRHSNIRLIFNEKNYGAGYTRNLLVNEARGNYTVFFDDDDISHPSRARQQIAGLSLSSDDQISIGRLEHYFNNSYLGPRRTFGRYGTNLSSSIGFRLAANEIIRHTNLKQVQSVLGIEPNGHYALGTSLMAASTAIFRRLGFDEKLRRMQDLDLVFRFCAEGGRLTQPDDYLIRVFPHPTEDKRWDIVLKASSYILEKNRQLFLDLKIDVDQVLLANQGGAVDAENADEWAWQKMRSLATRLSKFRR